MPCTPCGPTFPFSPLSPFGSTKFNIWSGASPIIVADASSPLDTSPIDSEVVAPVSPCIPCSPLGPWSPFSPVFPFGPIGKTKFNI